MVMKNKKPWRPDNWKKLWHKAEEKFRVYRNSEYCDDIWFEAGADAMLKSLRSVGFGVAEGVSVVIPNDKGVRNGS